MRTIASVVCACLWLGTLYAAPKPHVVNFGQWQTVAWFSSTNPHKATTLRIRSLYADGRLKEHTTGPARDITDRVFVVRSVYQVNDALPEEKQPRWRWQLGGWISVDRSTGRVVSLKMPEFDSDYSEVSWYRDYAAYSGVSEDGKKIYGVVV